MNRFVFLGTGGSLGVPIIGCKCEVCTSKNPHNKRLRPSGVFYINGKTLLVDVGPDFREQALKFNLTNLDAVLFTHTHYDHIGGVDDLRIYYLLQKKKPLCVASEETFRELKHRYHYLFKVTDEGEDRAVHMDFKLLSDDYGKFELFSTPIHYISYYQNAMKVNGFRIGNFAYVSDICRYDEQIFTSLAGIDTLVVSALRYTPSEVHFTIDEAIAFSRKVKAKRTFITHIAHELEHEKTNAALPKDVQLSYDGLEIPL